MSSPRTVYNWTEAYNGKFYAISEVAFDAKADKKIPRPLGKPQDVPAFWAQPYLITPGAHRCQTHSKVHRRCGIDHNIRQWPTSGLLVIERCEDTCGFCGLHTKYPWHLRRHVVDIHVKKDYHDLTVADGWTGANGEIRKSAQKGESSKTTLQEPVAAVAVAAPAASVPVPVNAAWGTPAVPFSPEEEMALASVPVAASVENEVEMVEGEGQGEGEMDLAAIAEEMVAKCLAKEAEEAEMAAAVEELLAAQEKEEELAAAAEAAAQKEKEKAEEEELAAAVATARQMEEEDFSAFIDAALVPGSLEERVFAQLFQEPRPEEVNGLQVVEAAGPNSSTSNSDTDPDGINWDSVIDFEGEQVTF